jgi:hypothetical protein
MDFKYNFVLDDFKNGSLNSDLFKKQIKINLLITANYIRSSSGYNPNVYLHFDSILTTLEQNELLAVVNNHTGEIENDFKKVNTTNLTDDTFKDVINFENVLSSGIYFINWSFFIDVKNTDQYVQYQIMLNDEIISEHTIRNQICVSQRYKINMAESGDCVFKLQMKCEFLCTVDISEVSVWFSSPQEL